MRGTWGRLARRGSQVFGFDAVALDVRREALADRRLGQPELADVVRVAAELASHGIRVNCLHPGLFDTDMTSWVMDDKDILPIVLEKIPLGRAAQPHEMGPVVAFMASDDAGYITGQSLYVDGGMLIL